MTKKEATDTNSKKLYELGYLLVSSIAEDHVAAEVEAIKSAITKAEAEIVSEDSPKLIPLAYSMVHGASGQKKKFDKAYFGWIKFTAEATSVEFINRFCHEHEQFLRFMIVKTVKDEPQSAPRAHLKTVVAESSSASQHLTPETTPEVAKKLDKKPLDEAELDKTLERLVI